MSRKITPSANKAHEIAQLLDGQSDVYRGAELLSAWLRLSTSQVLQETLEQEQTGDTRPGSLRTAGDPTRI